MRCSQCGKEASCIYGLVGTVPHDETFCTRACLAAYCHDHGYLNAAERRIAELEKQVTELQALINPTCGEPR